MDPPPTETVHKDFCWKWAPNILLGSHATAARTCLEPRGYLCIDPDPRDWQPSAGTMGHSLRGVETVSVFMWTVAILAVQYSKCVAVQYWQ